MQQVFNILGTALGTLGLAVCAITGSARLVGHLYLMGFESVTLFIAGIALLSGACFLKLEAASCKC